MANDLKHLSTAELLGIVTAPGDRPLLAAAAAELVLRYKKVVYAQALAVCGKRPDLADDVFQETFIRLFSWLKNHKHEPLHSFPGLLKAFSHRVAIDLLRKEGVARPVGLVSELVEPDIELALYVQQLLEALDDRSAEVLRQSYLEGRSAKEISDMLGIAPGNVRVIRHRALETIRAQEALDDYADQVEPV